MQGVGRPGRDPYQSRGRLQYGHRENRLRRAGVALSWRVRPAVPAVRARIFAIHGWGSSSETWSPLVHALAKDIEFVATDLRGHGKSAVAPDRHTITAMTDDSCAVLAQAEAVGAKAPLLIMGHSMGGNVAVRVGAQLGRSVAALVLIDPAMGGDEIQVGAVHGRLSDLDRLGSAAPAATVRESFGPSADERMVNRARRTMLATPSRVLKESLVSTFLDDAEIGSLTGTRRVSCLLDVPVVRLYPSESRAACDATWGWRHGRAYVVPGTGHFLHEEAPARVACIVEGVLGTLLAGG